MTSANPGHHIPETPKPMISAITAARIRMTVIVLFKKRKDVRDYFTAFSPPPPTPAGWGAVGLK